MKLYGDKVMAAFVVITEQNNIPYCPENVPLVMSKMPEEFQTEEVRQLVTSMMNHPNEIC